MALITDITRKEVTDIVYNFFADECEVDIKDIHADTNIINDIEGKKFFKISVFRISANGNKGYRKKSILPLHVDGSFRNYRRGDLIEIFHS